MKKEKETKSKISRKKDIINIIISGIILIIVTIVILISKGYNILPPKKIDEKDIAKYIKKHYDSTFDLDSYYLGVVENVDETIYDFNLIIDGAKADVGYTVFVVNNEIKVIDNMNGYDKSKINIQHKENFDEEAAKRDALKKYSAMANDDVSITIESTSKTFNTKENKKYFNVIIHSYDKVLDISAVYVESYEM